MKGFDVGELAGARVVALNGYSAMAKLGKGALLNWVFDQPGADTTFHLFVYLTDSESQRVFDAEYDAGMLEPVRLDLRHRGAILAVETDGEVSTRRYVIPDRGLETEFIADLMVAAKHLPEYVQAVRTGSNAQLEMLERDEASAETRGSAGRDSWTQLTPGLHSRARHRAGLRDRLNAVLDRADNSPDDEAVRNVLRTTFA
ncbi:hypothetical protein [Nocardia sp. NPDC003979]